MSKYTHAQILEKVLKEFAEISDMDIEKLRQSYLRGEDIADDIGIESLEFLDITFALGKEFGFKMHIEEWVHTYERITLGKDVLPSGKNRLTIGHVVACIEDHFELPITPIPDYYAAPPPVIKLIKPVKTRQKKTKS